MSGLAALLPFANACIPLIQGWITPYNCTLKITRPRQTKLGDFRAPKPGKPPVITMNGNLGPYQFLTTLVHEIAHLHTWHKYGRSVAPHGKEWKSCFAALLHELLSTPGIEWPPSFEAALQRHALNPKSSVAGDPLLQKTLLSLDGHTGTLLGDIADGTWFEYKGVQYQKLNKRRTRVLVQTKGSLLKKGKQFLIPVVAAVKPLGNG